MITKNYETLVQTINRLQSILETDRSLKFSDKAILSMVVEDLSKVVSNNEELKSS